MQKIILILTMGICMTTIPLHARLNCINPSEAEKIVCTIYNDIKNAGFSIPAHESEDITNRGGAPTYGEITPEGARELLKELNVQEHDVFFDLGSGIGKLCMLVHLTTPAQKSIGVELSPTRCNYAVESCKKLQEQLGKEYKKLKRKSLEFRQEDMLETSLDDATIIYMCSTCFAEPLLQKLNERFAQLPKGTRVISLKALPQHKDLQLTKTMQLPMTWSKSTTVNIYEVV